MRATLRAAPHASADGQPVAEPERPGVLCGRLAVRTDAGRADSRYRRPTQHRLARRRPPRRDRRAARGPERSPPAGQRARRARRDASATGRLGADGLPRSPAAPARAGRRHPTAGVSMPDATHSSSRSTSVRRQAPPAARSRPVREPPQPPRAASALASTSGLYERKPRRAPSPASRAPRRRGPRSTKNGLPPVLCDRAHSPSTPDGSASSVDRRRRQRRNRQPPAARPLANSPSTSRSGWAPSELIVAIARHHQRRDRLDPPRRATGTRRAWPRPPNARPRSPRSWAPQRPLRRTAPRSS